MRLKGLRKTTLSTLVRVGAGGRRNSSFMADARNPGAMIYAETSFDGVCRRPKVTGVAIDRSGSVTCGIGFSP